MAYSSRHKIRPMTKLLEEAIAKVRELSEAEQDMAAVELMRYLESTRDPRLSDEILESVREKLI